MNLTKESVEWVVNKYGELGVKIGNQFFYLYKGRSLCYDPESAMKWRYVGKREFGECCYPDWFIKALKELWDNRGKYLRDELLSPPTFESYGGEWHGQEEVKVA